MNDTQVDSCRHCGKCLDILSTCLICEQPSRYQCTACYHFIDDPVHTECIIFEEV